ncbi:hypothetical protein JZ751_020565 [Albula glossodonta]|uniref:Uncharacterized protein n=1 Tax=Albula glossodonta TaxID=121402 RepID=A0A8T2PMX1_9TELE|nr:hypothetical protein JZ751_020565 [Albula glossodonta]
MGASALRTSKDGRVCSSSGTAEGEVGGEDEEDGKANCPAATGSSPDESTRSGIPGDVPTVSVTTSSGSRMKSSSWEISVTLVPSSDENSTTDTFTHLEHQSLEGRMKRGTTIRPNGIAERGEEKQDSRARDCSAASIVPRNRGELKAVTLHEAAAKYHINQRDFLVHTKLAPDNEWAHPLNGNLSRKGLVVMHADAADADPETLRNWLLAAGTQDRGQLSDKHHAFTRHFPSTALHRGEMEEKGEAEAFAHSFRSGMEVLLLVFCTMLAWFLREMRITEGASLQGSPSTCMGMDL